MQLPRDGQEYAHLTFSSLTFNVAVEVSVDDRATWNATEADSSANQRKVLLRGPRSDRDEGLLIREDKTTLWVRVVDNPETVVRPAGQIFFE